MFGVKTKGKKKGEGVREVVFKLYPSYELKAFHFD
jgi:hypothetical protein